jgi:hypothetical protein
MNAWAIDATIFRGLWRTDRNSKRKGRLVYAPQTRKRDFLIWQQPAVKLEIADNQYIKLAVRWPEYL